MTLAMTPVEESQLFDFLKECSEKVEDMLESLLPQPDDELEESRLFEAMRYSVFAGGKRLRPFLILSTNQLLGGEQTPAIEERAVRVAAAIEMLHTFSLIHDDLPCMDNDNLRRGKPTCHVQFDEFTAVLAGDALLSSCFEVLADFQTHPDASIRAELVRIAAASTGPLGMMGGQMIDMLAEQREEGERVVEQGELARLQRKKTGALFQACCECAALLNHADKMVQLHLQSYARNVGLAFQMIDDVLDVTGTKEQLGKTPGKDAIANKATFATLLGVDGARRQAEALCEQAQEQLAHFGPEAQPLRLLARYIVNRSY
ncbi:MAG: polyprenyl synthetase family protein [Alphaproteobacteria bacterium]|nr:polyprenyl synthetase family protein [Alphaproteobacteria bacterium]MDD9919850.1 polyprenyl synthetase family protein [Alphaproteobacteria bacterium]